MGRLEFEGSSLGMLCVLHSRLDVSAEQFCAGLWPEGAQSGSLNPLELAELSRMDSSGFANRA